MKSLHENSTKLLLIAITLFGLTFGSRTEGQNTESRVRLSFDMMEFKLGDQKGAENISFDDSNWRALDLPHDGVLKDLQQDEPTGGSGGYLQQVLAGIVIILKYQKVI